MTRPTREGLPPDVRALLRAEREHVAITDDARVRLGARLAASVAAFGAPPSPPLTSAPAPAPVAMTATAAKTAGLGVAATKMAVALALTATAIVGGQRWLGDPSDHAPILATAMATMPAAEPTLPATPAMPVVTREDVPPAPPPAEPSAPAVPSPARSLHARAARPTPVAPPTVAPPTQPPSEVGGLREEQELLEEARADLDRGDSLAALAATDAHARRFPGGTLAEAGDALRIRALVRLGRSEDAKLAIATFRAHHPHSLLLGTNP